MRSEKCEDRSARAKSSVVQHFSTNPWSMIHTFVYSE